MGRRPRSRSNQRPATGTENTRMRRSKFSINPDDISDASQEARKAPPKKTIKNTIPQPRPRFSQASHRGTRIGVFAAHDWIASSVQVRTGPCRELHGDPTAGLRRCAALPADSLVYI
jgi:hypothetical protein